jgi:hypothetical protein
MGAEVDPQRQRRLAELARWHDEWQQKWDIDEELDPDDPAITPEAQREYQARADEIMGRDPATGRYRED